MNISQLLDNALQNDQRSYNQLFDIHWDYVYGFLLKKTRNPIVAEEIAVRSFSNAFDKIHQFDREARFSTWLIAIAQNLWIDSERKNQSQKTRFTETRAEVSEFENFQKNPEEEMIAQQKLDQLLEHIQSLAPDYRILIQLRYFKGYSYNKLSEDLDQPLNTIKVKLFRAKKLLAEKLKI